MNRSAPIPINLRGVVIRLGDAIGPERVQRLFDLDPRTYGRVVAGLAVSNGTLAAVRLGLAVAFNASSAADLLTEDEIIRARGDARPIGEAADAVARTVTATGGTP